MDKEIHTFSHPAGVESFVFQFSSKALQWLCGTTTDDDGRKTNNIALFNDLLVRMALTDGTAQGFHRPLRLSAGQAQYSEELLSEQWKMGRKRIRCLLDKLTLLGLIETHRSRVASMMTFPCLLKWETADNGSIATPSSLKQRESQELQ